MSAFRFRLARVLRVRRLQEEIARGELLAAREAAQVARDAADEVAAAQLQGREDLLTLMQRPRLAPGDLLARHDALDGLRGLRAVRETRAAEREQVLERRRDEALAARSAVRGLERLEERRRGLHVAALEAAERAATDEVAQRRAAERAAGPVSSPTPRPSDEPGKVPGGPTGPGPRPVAPR